MNKLQSMLAFALASVALAGAGLLLSIRADTGPHANLGAPALVAFPFGVGWSICVYVAYRRHGRRAAWLLLGFPVAWFYPILTALFVLGHVLQGGGV
jgi:hypothetical protein